VGRLWLCYDILKLTVNSGAGVIKCVKTVVQESKALFIGPRRDQYGYP